MKISTMERHFTCLGDTIGHHLQNITIPVSTIGYKPTREEFKAMLQYAYQIHVNKIRIIVEYLPDGTVRTQDLWDEE
jgi:flagellar basal body rod protein FlgG